MGSMVSASEEKTIQAIDDMLEQQIMDGLLNCHVERECLWWAINDMLEQQIIGGLLQMLAHNENKCRTPRTSLMTCWNKTSGASKNIGLAPLMSCWNSTFLLSVGPLAIEQNH